MQLLLLTKCEIPVVRQLDQHVCRIEFWSKYDFDWLAGVDGKLVSNSTVDGKTLFTSTSITTSRAISPVPQVSQKVLCLKCTFQNYGDLRNNEWEESSTVLHGGKVI